MPTKSITPRATTTGRSISPLLGVPPNARVGTTTFTKSTSGGASVSRVRSVSSQRAVYTIVTGGAVVRTDSTNVASRPGGEADAPPPHVSLRSLSPAFQPLEPGVYSHMPSRAATSRSGSVVATTTTTTTTTTPAVAAGINEVPPQQPSSARASLAAPPGYSDALKKSSAASMATRRSASREPGPLASSRQHLLRSNSGQKRAASSDAKPLPSKEQLNSLRPKKSVAPSSAGVPSVAAKLVVAPRKRSADSLIPRVAAPPMNPSVQPRTYRRSLSTDAVPHMSRGASADRQPLTARQHHPQPVTLNVVSSRGKSSDAHKPTKVQQQALRPPGQKVTAAAVARPATTAPTSSSAAHRTASESGDAFTATVPTATPSTQRNAATAKLDYSDNEWSTPKEEPFVHDIQPILIPDLDVVGEAVAVSEYDPSEADGHHRTTANEHQQKTQVTIPTLKLGSTAPAHHQHQPQPTTISSSPSSEVVVQQPIHVVQFDAPTVNFAARQRIAHNRSKLEERELDTNKAAALCKRFDCGDAISMQHRGRHFLNTNNLVGTCSRRSASGGGGKPTVSARSGSASQYASRSVSPDISLRHVYQGRSIDDPHHNQPSISHRSGSCNTTTNATATTAATRAQEIEDRLQRFSHQRQMNRQLAVPVHHYSRPTETMQHESLRRNQLPNGNTVVDSSPILSSQGVGSPPSSPSKLVPLLSSKELSNKSFERSPDRSKELKNSQKTTFKRLLELGMEEDANRASSMSANNKNNQHQEPKWVVDEGSAHTTMNASHSQNGGAPPSLDCTQGGGGAVPAIRHFEPFQRDATTTSPLLSRRADSPRGARSGTSFEDSMNSDGNNNSVYLTTATTADTTATNDQPRISPDTYKDFEQQKAAKAMAEKKRLDEEQAAKRRQEAMHIAYARMKSPVPIPERAPARNLY